MDFDGKIENIWNASVVSDDGRIVLSNAGWNKNITVGDEASFGFIAMVDSDEMEPDGFEVKNSKEEKTENVEDESAILIEAKEFASDNYKAMSALLDLDTDSLYLEEPYQMYSVDDEEKQLASFGFPVYERDKCVALYSVHKTVAGWTDGITKYQIENFNDLEYNTSECILYRIGDYEFIENASEKREMNGYKINAENMLAGEKAFYDMTYQKKKKYIANKNIIYNEINNQVNDKSYEERTDGYVPKLLINTGDTVECDAGAYLKSQGNDPICWAACVASTYNYLKGKNVTARDVCKKMKTGYVSANAIMVLNAFKSYGLNYKCTYPKYPNDSNIKACLRDNYLITVRLGTFNDYIHLSYHDALITGLYYNRKVIRNGNKKVESRGTELRVYDPNRNKMEWVTYTGDNTVFFQTWGWKDSYIPANHAPFL